METKTKAMHRCNICNKVNSLHIATDFGQFTPRDFREDPTSSFGMICMDCADSIADSNAEIDVWIDDESEIEIVVKEEGYD